MSAERDLAGRVVELVRRIAGPQAQAEVVVTRSDLALARFANSFIHQNVAESGTTVRLRLHTDGRTAAGSGSLVDTDGLTALVERTRTAARLAPPDPAWPGLTPPAPVPADGIFDEATAYASPDERAARVRAFVDAAGGLEAAGYCRTAYRSGAFANSAGQSAVGRTAEAAMDGIARTGGSDGVARLCADRLADIDGAALGARAAAKARAAADPVELPPGRYEVVLEPAAVADLLQNLAWYGFNGKRYAERQSFAEPGAAQFDPAVTLVDDPLHASGLPYDLEGTPRRALPLVEAGTTRGVAQDRRSGAEAGTGSTGHGMLGGSTFGPIPRNLRLLPADGGTGVAAGAVTGGVSGAVADPDTAALVAGMTRGLLVTDFWYTRVLDPKRLVITGLTRNGVWLVEDGVPTRAVRDFRFTESYPRALGPGGVLGLGRTPVRQPDRVDGAWWEAPPLRLASWNFTGGASG
ncbi:MULTISPECIES: TldD/PmbA family protein [Micromonospora]|uniref:TldD/PmbA family protein n=1 Tax=Micromonospora solifontis TaxID=2487138 RepID=A0ABX9WIH7_9ACTN|nr:MULTISPECIES: metallopeptidase TldD-related protein [Micromonospora]NES15331.1 TldD/PmbA family protein [Micromonospora sp. PPF5-17B]NES36122.1 TldD/PmbA family protein [Micromonospora solifontis]NES56679.1 TldD/PmbA family protein [Micromonospora sp. PPF5-6]RNL99878.1 TldD/PmbA family protein [Micromonospora solifontis]